MQNIILLHGALGCAANLDKLKQVLQNSGFRVYSFSFSGHGSSAFSQSFGIPQFTNELAGFIASEGIINPVIFGYSMGGYVALNYLIRNNAAVSKVVTLGTKFDWTEESMRKETARLIPEHLAIKAPAFVDALKMLHGEKWAELLSKTAAIMEDIHINNYLNEQNLKSISTTIVLGLADKDNMVSVEETKKVQALIPKAQMFMLPGAKHDVGSSNFEILAQIIAL